MQAGNPTRVLWLTVALCAAPRASRAEPVVVRIAPSAVGDDRQVELTSVLPDGQPFTLEFQPRELPVDRVTVMIVPVDRRCERFVQPPVSDWKDCPQHYVLAMMPAKVDGVSVWRAAVPTLQSNQNYRIVIARSASLTSTLADAPLRIAHALSAAISAQLPHPAGCPAAPVFAPDPSEPWIAIIKQAVRQAIREVVVRNFLTGPIAGLDAKLDDLAARTYAALNAPRQPPEPRPPAAPAPAPAPPAAPPPVTPPAAAAPAAAATPSFQRLNDLLIDHRMLNAQLACARTADSRAGVAVQIRDIEAEIAGAERSLADDLAAVVTAALADADLRAAAQTVSTTHLAGEGATPDKGNFASPDLGVAFAFPRPGDRIQFWTLPYVGLNLYATTVDRKIAFSNLAGTGIERLEQRISLTVGLTLSNPSLPGFSISGPLANRYPVVALGVRLSHYTRFTAGVVMYQVGSQSPLDASTSIRVAGFAGLSLDADVVALVRTAYPSL